MAATDEYTDYVLDHLASIGSVKPTRFFGGVGLSLESLQFAMIMDKSLYFAVDDATRPWYEAAGMQSFSYGTKKGRVQVRRYFELPEDVLSDPGELRLWVHEALRVAEQTKKPAGRAKRKRRARGRT
jgi:DNA transformation protein